MMLALVGVLAVLQDPPVRGVVLDGALGTPVVAALLSVRDATTRTDATGHFAIAARIGDTLRVRRIGYREARVLVDAPALSIALTPVAATLGTVRIADSAHVGRLSAARSTDELRERGVTTVADALATMPFVAARGTHGESTLSMRGSRPEQVVVLIDGMPLNDPATGRADVSDLPLSALGGVSVTPGAAASQLGSGASGGVVALSSGEGTTATLSGTSLGGVSGEGAWAPSLARGSVRIGAALARTENEFEFVNDAGARDTVETRHNADERRASVFGSAVLGRAQLVALYAARERGLAGPKNVRAYDDARESTDRRLARVRVGGERWLASTGVRRLAVHYRDRSHSELASDAFGTTVDADGVLALGPVSLRAGGAREVVWGSELASTTRPSAFASGGVRSRIGVFVTDATVRLDVVEGARGQLSPSVAIERPGAATPFVRVAQGFRVPAFYDLYVPTPLGYVATGVEPERVVLDGEAGVRVSRRAMSLSASAFARNMRDAIVWFPGNFNWSPSNVERERVHGVEARAELSTPRLAAELWAAYHITRLSVDDITIPTPYVARYAGGASARAALGRFGFSTLLSATGRRPFAVAPASRTLELPGVLLADVSASWRMPSHRGSALVTAGALNILNTPHESVRRYPSPGRSWQFALTVQP